MTYRKWYVFSALADSGLVSSIADMPSSAVGLKSKDVVGSGCCILVMGGVVSEVKIIVVV